MALAWSCLRQTRRKEEEALMGRPDASAGWREKGLVAGLAGREAGSRREEAGRAGRVSRTRPAWKERAMSEAGRLGRKQGKGK